MMTSPAIEALRNWYSVVGACPSCHGPIILITFNWHDQRITIANWCYRCKDWEIQEL